MSIVIQANKHILHVNYVILNKLFFRKITKRLLTNDPEMMSRFEKTTLELYCCIIMPVSQQLILVSRMLRRTIYDLLLSRSNL